MSPAEAAADLTQRLANHQVVTSTTPHILERYFFEQLQIYPQISGLYYGTADGRFYYVSRGVGDHKGLLRTKLIHVKNGQRRVELLWRDKDYKLVEQKYTPEDAFDPRTRPWYAQAQAAQKLVWTNPYVFYSAHTPGITTASPVVDEDGKLKGVVGVDVDIAQISTFLSKLDIGVTGSAFIISQNGDVIAYPDSNLITQTQDDKGEGLRFKRIDELDDPIARASFASLNLPSGRFQLDRSQYTAFDVNGIAYHAIFAPFQNEKWPWLVGIYVPENDFLGALYENRTANIYIAIVIGLIACLIAVVMVRGITRSLDGLRQNAQNIMRGDYKNQHDFPTPYQEVQETADAFKHMVAALEEKERQNIELTEELRKTSITTILRMSSAAEYKDHDTGQHIQRLSDICAAVSEHMGQPPKWTEMFRYAVPMHDLEKIGIPDEILMKPGPLTPDEREVINSHAGIGASILNSSDTKLLEMARIIALQHHEHWDGNGYPQSLQGLEIALEARICAIADVFDALISKRCYKDAMPFDEALRFITDGSGTQFDPACVDAFVGVKDEIWVLYETAKAMNEPA